MANSARPGRKIKGLEERRTTFEWEGSDRQRHEDECVHIRALTLCAAPSVNTALSSFIVGVWDQTVAAQAALALADMRQNQKRMGVESVCFMCK